MQTQQNPILKSRKTAKKKKKNKKREKKKKKKKKKVKVQLVSQHSRLQNLGLLRSLYVQNELSILIDMLHYDMLATWLR
jgi:hypothetical protein